MKNITADLSQAGSHTDTRSRPASSTTELSQAGVQVRFARATRTPLRRTLPPSLHALCAHEGLLLTPAPQAGSSRLQEGRSRGRYSGFASTASSMLTVGTTGFAVNLPERRSSLAVHPSSRHASSDFVKGPQAAHWHLPSVSRLVSMTVLAAACAVALGLAGCGSDGTSASNSMPTVPNSPNGTNNTPTTTDTASNTGVATEIGKTATDLGTVIANTPLPAGISPQVSQGLGNTVASAGDIVSDLGTGIGNGLGKIGSSSDPVGATVSSLGNVVSDAGGTVVGVGTVIGGLGNGGPLGALNPVTAPLAGAVGLVGTTVESAGHTLGATLSSGPVQQLTQQVSTAITPIVTTLGSATQTVGGMTGLGAPADNLLQAVGGAVSQAGKTVSGSTDNIVVADVGNVVSSVGNTVAGVGSVLDHNGINGNAPIAGLLANLGNVSAAPVSGTGTSAGTLGPLSGLLSNLGNLGNLGGIAGLGGGSSAVGSTAANPLAPLTTLLGAPVVTTTSNGVAPAGSGATNGGSLGGVTSLLSSLTGSLGSLGGIGATSNNSQVTRAAEKTPGAVVH